MHAVTTISGKASVETDIPCEGQQATQGSSKQPCQRRGRMTNLHAKQYQDEVSCKIK